MHVFVSLLNLIAIYYFVSKRYLTSIEKCHLYAGMSTSSETDYESKADVENGKQN